MLNCCIIDDQIDAVNVLLGHAQQMDMKVLFSETNPVRALQKMSALETPVDILFCDIDMPGISGLELASLIEKDIMLVFTTAHEEFAVAGYGVEATHFLVKPITYPDFANCVAHCQRKKDRLSRSTNQGSPFLEHLVFHLHDTKAGLVRVATSEIVYISLKGNYVFLRQKDKEELVQSYNTFSKMEPYLDPEKFVRVSRNYIVNMDFVKGVNKKQVHLLNGIAPNKVEKDMELGDQYRRNFIDKMGKFIKAKDKPPGPPLA